MRIIDQELEKWLDGDVPFDSPRVLKEGAPEHIKIKFEELLKYEEEEERRWDPKNWNNGIKRK